MLTMMSAIQQSSSNALSLRVSDAVSPLA